MKLGKLIIPTLFFFFKVILSALVHLPLHIYLQTILSLSKKKSCLDLSRNRIYLLTNWWKINIFIILSLTWSQYVLPFFIFLISFISFLYFSAYKFCTHFVNFTPEYFICLSGCKWYNIFYFSICIFICYTYKHDWFL